MTDQDRLGGAIVGGSTLLPGLDEPEPAMVRWSGSTIDAIDTVDSVDAIDPIDTVDSVDAIDPIDTGGRVDDRGRAAAGRSTAGPPDQRGAGPVVVDARGALVLPGIIDLHGDAFERAIMPRAGIEIDLDVGLADNDAQLLAAGITTAFLSATDSWEPGLRGRPMLRRLIERLGRRGGDPDLRLHVRHERCNTAGHDELMGWITDGTVDLLSFNDHAPGGTARMPDGVSPLQAERAGLPAEQLLALQAEAVERRSLGLEQEAALAAAAVEAGCVTASHDPDDEVHVQRDLDLGIGITEFPTSIGLARRYRDEGVDVVLGAPNLVRGGSHVGHLTVADALHAGVDSILCSDYHYPSLLQAPFTYCAADGVSLAEAWRLVSSDPARAVGLDDRGRLEVGARADLIVVEPPTASAPARVRAVVVAGRVALLRS